MTDLPPLTATSAAADEVCVWGAQGKNTTWHTDRGCTWFSRHADRPVEIWGQAASMEPALAGDRRHRRLPCAACAQPTLIALAARLAAEHPDRADSLVLGCPQSRIAHDGDHRRCRCCARLRDLATAHDAVAYTDPHGYQLAHLVLHRDLTSVARRAWAVHQVPDGIDVTAEVLQVAWARRDSGKPAPGLLPAVRDDRHGVYFAVTALDFEVAALITAAPADTAHGTSRP